MQKFNNIGIGIPDAHTEQNPRIDWDSYFLSMCFLIAQRSKDESTKHGAVWVDSNHRILSIGYNGPIAGSEDTQIPQTYPEKQFHWIHAEENCLLNYNGNLLYAASGSTMYISGRFCSLCLRKMLQIGIKRYVIGKVQSKCINDLDLEAQKLMLSNRNIEIITLNTKNILFPLEQAIDYLKLRS